MQVAGPETFYPASDPLVWSVGRFVLNSDGSKSFDWENSQLHINVVNASYVKLLVNATGEVMGRFLVSAQPPLFCPLSCSALTLPPTPCL